MDVAAIFFADSHFGHRRPIARSPEDWYAAQRRVIDQLADLSEKYQAPLVCAGDLLDRWNEPAELVNFLIRRLPKIYSIAGNHDTPYHQPKELKKSAYWTLVEAGTVVNVPAGKPVEINPGRPVRLHGFPCGSPVRPLGSPHDLVIEVALVHDYIWTEKTGHPGAPPDKQLWTWRPKLKGFDVAVFGDNHRTIHHALTIEKSICQVLNCGGLQRRHADEIKHAPSVGLLLADGKIKRHFLDCTEDKFSNPDELTTVAGGDVSGFIDELGNLADSGMDFEETVRRFVADNDLREGVKRLLLESLENWK